MFMLTLSREVMLAVCQLFLEDSTSKRAKLVLGVKRRNEVLFDPILCRA